MSDKRKIIIPIVLVLLIGGYFIFKYVYRENPNVISGSGTIEVTEVDISSKLSGRIVKLNAEEGSAVRAGQLLVELNHDELSAQFESAKEQVKQLDTQTKNSDSNFKRAKELLAAGGYSQQAFDRDETLFKVTSSQYESAKQNLNLLKAQIDNAYLVTPISGVVLQKNSELGEMASPGMSVMTIGDMSKPWLKIYVPEDRIPRIKLGDKAYVSLDAYDRKFEGKVTYISSTAEFTPKNVQTKEDRVRQVFAVKIALENKEGIFKPGMPADAVINASNN